MKVNCNRSIVDIQTDLRAKGIPTRRLFPPIVEFPPYRRYATEDYREARDLFDKGLNLPSATTNGAREIDRVIATIIDVIGT